MNRSSTSALLAVLTIAAPALALAKKPAATAAAAAPTLTKEQVEKLITDDLKFADVAATLGKKLGPAQVANGRAPIWYYETKKEKGNVYCSSVKLVPTPFGHAIAETSVMNGDPCNATKLTEKQVKPLIEKVENTPFDGIPATVAYTDQVKALEAKIGKAAKTEQFQDEFHTISFRYAGEDGQCKYVTLVNEGISSSFSTRWNLDCTK